MKQEDKELLIKDLGARLPYQPLCKKVDTEDDFCECDAPLGYSLRDLVDNKTIIKPYLRPMSSMTEEEKEELSHYEDSVQRTDFFYSHHIDCRFMIEKGLALEAPEGIYDIAKFLNMDTNYYPSDFSSREEYVRYLHENAFAVDIPECLNEKPKHSYFERIYHLGSEPRWKTGDVLGGYECYSDREGTYILGEIVDVKMDKDKSDWLYTFKNEDIIEESELLTEGVCKIN